MTADAPDPTLTVVRRDDGVVVVRVDDPDAAVNTLRRDLADEVGALLDELEKDERVTGLVLASGKPDSFIAGADLEMLREVHCAADGVALSRLAQDVGQRIADFRVPTAAAVHGTCLGGGLELVLAFDARLASDHAATRFGLPEVRLGLLPGGGGTWRLPRLVGVRVALDLLLTGRELDAHRALAVGLVDGLVPEGQLVESAVQRVRALARLRRPGRRSPVDRPLTSVLSVAGLAERVLVGNPLGRRFVFGRAHTALRRRTRGRYPAPERILDVVRDGYEGGMAAGLAAESRAFGDLLMTPEARELIGLFFAVNASKKDTGVDSATAGPRSLARVGLVGAGLMGAGIAYVTAARAGLRVVLEDRDEAALERGIGRVRDLLAGRVARGRLTSGERDAVLGRIETSLDRDRLAGVDIVIEAVFEDLAVKRSILADLERLGNTSLIFASNTSSLPISRIAEGSARPGNVIGMHYFSPVDRMPLLEVVTTEQTAPEVIATCVALGKQQGKTVITVRDGPGFYTSRILAPYLNEAAWLLAEGNPIEAIDEALLDFGFPIGPLALVDEIGIDVAAKVAGVLEGALGARLKPPPGLTALSADGRLGRKSARGFYRYEGDRERRAGVDRSVYDILGVQPSSPAPAEEMAQRCVLVMVNEAVRCLEEGVLRSTRDGDLGAVFGLGFPPFLGGPFRYVAAIGASGTADRLARLHARFGERFAPASRLVEAARDGKPLS